MQSFSTGLAQDTILSFVDIPSLRLEGRGTQVVVKRSRLPRSKESAAELIKKQPAV